jgi:hypothetical protein
MRCGEQRMLLAEEHRAWNAYKALQDSGSQDKQEIAMRANDAGVVSLRLWEHISRCQTCQAHTVDRSRPASGCDRNQDFSTGKSPEHQATLGI